MVFNHKVVGFLVCEHSFINIQVANTVKFMTELPDVFITFDKMSMLNGPDDFKKTDEPSEAYGRKDEDIHKPGYSHLTHRF